MAEPILPLKKDWYTEVVVDGVNCDLRGFYKWEIEGVGSYIGKYTKISRPRRHYGRIVSNLLAGKRYRLSKPDKFRRIHTALADGLRTGKTITLTILENCPPGEDINAREQQLIREHGCNLNG